EMERRGASETIGIDVLDPMQWDWPAGSEEAVIQVMAQRQVAGTGFEIARDALGSSVERLDLSVYDLDPSTVGTFDFVYLGSLLQPPKPIWIPAEAGNPPARLSSTLLRSEEARQRFLTALKGDPHAAVLAEPRVP